MFKFGGKFFVTHENVFDSFFILTFVKFFILIIRDRRLKNRHVASGTTVREWSQGASINISGKTPMDCCGSQPAIAYMFVILQNGLVRCMDGST